MRFTLALVTATALAGSAVAQPVPRSSDILLNKSDLTNLVAGQMIEFYTGGFARYGEDGGYDYRYEIDGPPAPGVYEVTDESMICTVFHNGFERCDMLVLAGERYVLIIENGERYPVKSISPLE